MFLLLLSFALLAACADWPHFGGINAGSAPIHVEPSGMVDELIPYLQWRTEPRSLAPYATAGPVATEMTRVTDAAAFGLPSGTRFSNHYAKRPAWNTDDSLVIIYYELPSGGTLGHALLDGQTFEFVGLRSGMSISGRWSNTEPEYWYQAISSSGVLSKLNVYTGATTTVLDVGAFGYTSFNRWMFFGEGSQSNDDAVWAFLCRDASTSAWRIVVVDVAAQQERCAIEMPNGGSDLDWYSVSQSGAYVVLNTGNRQSSANGVSFLGTAVFSATTCAYFRQLPNAGTGHYDLCIDSSGRDVATFMTTKYGSNDKVGQTWRLDGSSGSTTQDQWPNGYLGWSFHMSCRSTQQPSLLLVCSGLQYPQSNYDGYPFYNTAFFVALNGSLVPAFAAQLHHDESDDSTGSGDRSPTAVANRAGTAFLWRSKWDSASVNDAVHVYVARRAGGGTAAPTTTTTVAPTTTTATPTTATAAPTTTTAAPTTTTSAPTSTPPSSDWPHFGGIIAFSAPIHVEPSGMVDGLIPYLQWRTEPRSLPPYSTAGPVATEVTRVTDAAAFGLPAGTKFSVHYSKRAAWNADDSLACIYYDRPDQARLLHALLDGQTLALVGLRSSMSVGGRWSNTEHSYWYQAISSASVLRKINVYTEAETVVFDVGARGYESCNTWMFFGEGSQSNDDAVWAFMCRESSSSEWRVVVVDVAAQQVRCAIAMPNAGSDLDWYSVSQGGDYIVLNAGSHTTTANGVTFTGTGVFSATTCAYLRQFAATSTGHYDLCFDASGHEVAAFMSPKYRSNDKIGQTWRLDGSSGSSTSDQWPDRYIGWSYHMSCRSNLNPTLLLVGSSLQYPQSNYNGFPMYNAAFFVHMNGTQAPEGVAFVTQLHHDESDDNTNSYGREPHPVANRWGTAIMWNAVWDASAGDKHVYVARRAGGGATMAAPTTTTAAPMTTTAAPTTTTAAPTTTTAAPTTTTAAPTTTTAAPTTTTAAPTTTTAAPTTTTAAPTTTTAAPTTTTAAPTTVAPTTTTAAPTTTTASPTTTAPTTTTAAPTMTTMAPNPSPNPPAFDTSSTTAATTTTSSAPPSSPPSSQLESSGVSVGWPLAVASGACLLYLCATLFLACAYFRQRRRAVELYGGSGGNARSTPPRRSRRATKTSSVGSRRSRGSSLAASIERRPRTLAASIERTRHAQAFRYY